MTDLAELKAELDRLASDRSIPYEDIFANEDNGFDCIDVTAIVAHDPMLVGAGNLRHRRTEVLVRMFLGSEDGETEVIWAQLRYTVARESSNFSPVPDEYGERVVTQYGWEFRRDTLELHGPAEVRDLDRLHYVSVLPNQDLVAFVETCSEVIDQRGESR